MIARSPVSFAQLRQFLGDLGFTQSRRGKFWFFEHASSGTVFGYRPYRASEKVTAMDLDMTRRHLDLRGVLDEQIFDDRLNKAIA